MQKNAVEAMCTNKDGKCLLSAFCSYTEPFPSRCPRHASRMPSSFHTALFPCFQADLQGL